MHTNGNTERNLDSERKMDRNYRLTQLVQRIHQTFYSSNNHAGVTSLHIWDHVYKTIEISNRNMY